MLLRLRNRLLPLLRAASPLPSPIHTRACRLLSTSTADSGVPFSLEDYLVTACGLAPAQVREVSKKLSRELLSNGSRRSLDELSHSRLNSASNPDAVLALLSGAGLSRADIADVVSADPLLLRASVKKIAPRLLALRDRVGLCGPQIARFLMVGSRALRRGDVCSRLEFFISFYGSFEQVMVVAKRCNRLLAVSLERVIEPNIALFRQCGVRDITKLISISPWLLTYSPELVKEVLLRAEELGVPPTSGMFRHAVAVLAGNSMEKVAAKLEFFKRTLGCSESEVSTAVSKKPSILGFSDEILLRKIEFLINKAAIEPRHIVERPVLLTYSLEKRLVPRHYVMKVLQEKGLLSTNTNLYSLASRGEEAFKSKFIDCYEDSVPGLADAYATARAALLRQRGVEDIAKLCSDNAWVLSFNPERVKEFLLRAEQLGVPPTSRMFRHAVAAIAHNSKEKVDAKLEFLKRTLGCSETEVSTAVSKMPSILGLSDEIIGCKIQFLINEAAMEPQYVVERPILLTFSLEKRLVPRHYVMKDLQEKGLLNSKMSFFTFAKLGEEAFKLRFIDCHKDSVPGLADAYATNCTGLVVPSRA